VASATQPITQGASTTRPAPRRRRQRSWAWLGLLPFFLFSLLFLFLPALYLIVGSFQDNAGNVTIKNYADLTTGIIPGAFWTTIEVSFVTAVLGGIFGFLLAYAVILGGLPRLMGLALFTFSGVASNFAGVPLALAFTFTLGQLGFLTVLLQGIGINIYDTGFKLPSKLGVELVYLYFQFPLMVLIIAPALNGLKREWKEAAENMGATSAQYWRHVALPILTPSILGAMILLFGNAFGAQATAFQLTGGTLNLVPIIIGAQIRGDVLHNPGLGYAMAMGMVVIMGVSILLYTILQRRSERWLRS
jgi:putative spermidine/putrescine transport system permease protein